MRILLNIGFCLLVFYFLSNYITEHINSMGEKVANRSKPTLINAVDVRINQEPTPVIIKSGECPIQALASSATLGEVELKPIVKTCNSNETVMQYKSIFLKAKQIKKANTGEIINTVQANKIIDITDWE